MAKSKKGESDWWSNEAKRLGYPARSVFKLKEINDKFHVFAKPEKVLDVGAAPGSWTQFISREILKGKGSVVACDLNPLSIPVDGTNITEVVGDAFCEENQQKILAFAPFDAVVSDAAPHTTGNRSVDCQRSLEIAEGVTTLSDKALGIGGNLVFKMYQGNETAELVKSLKKKFAKVSVFKPECSRSTSFECFVVAIGKKAEA